MGIGECPMENLVREKVLDHVCILETIDAV